MAGACYCRAIANAPTRALRRYVNQPAINALITMIHNSGFMLTPRQVRVDLTVLDDMRS